MVLILKRKFLLTGKASRLYPAGIYLFINQVFLIALACWKPITQYNWYHNITDHIFNSFCVPTVPCSPANLNLFRECSSNVIIFSWAPTNNTGFYTAQLTDSVGGAQTCLTTDTSCFFTNTMCGRKYSFTVYSVNGECNSPASTAVSIQTGKLILSFKIRIVRFWEKNYKKSYSIVT